MATENAPLSGFRALRGDGTRSSSLSRAGVGRSTRGSAAFPSPRYGFVLFLFYVSEADRVKSEGHAAARIIHIKSTVIVKAEMQ